MRKKSIELTEIQLQEGHRNKYQNQNNSNEQQRYALCWSVLGVSLAMLPSTVTQPNIAVKAFG